MERRATFQKRLSGWNSDVRLYQVDPAIGYDYDSDTEQPTRWTHYVVVNRVALPLQAEIYILPADKEGNILHWDWLAVTEHDNPGTDHRSALAWIGYKAG